MSAEMIGIMFLIAVIKGDINIDDVVSKFKQP